MSPQNVSVSIIIPFYNRPDLIKETIDSIKKQSFDNYEVLIIDDGSGQDEIKQTKSFIADDSRFTLLQRPVERKKGANSCRNYGYEKSNGQFILFLDSDDLLDSEYLISQIEMLNKYTNSKYTICDNVIFEDTPQNAVGKWFNSLVYSSQPLFEYVKKRLSIQTASPLFRKSFLEKIRKESGLFNEDLQQSQEWEFFCRVLFNEPNYLVNTKVLLFIRKHKTSITNELAQKKPELLSSQVYALILVQDYLLKNNALNDELRQFFINSLVTLFKHIGNKNLRWRIYQRIMFLLKPFYRHIFYKVQFHLGVLSWLILKRGHFLLKYNGYE